MTTHARHPDPTGREEFLVDGCPRCEEYLDELGLPFDPERFRAFWRKMISVEYDDEGGYASELDKQLGRRLYHLSLSLERAFALDPRAFEGWALSPRFTIILPDDLPPS